MLKVQCKVVQLFCCLLISPLSFAIDGNQLYDSCDVALSSEAHNDAYGTGYCYGYIVGVINETKEVFCAPKEATHKDTVGIVNSFLKQNLELLNEPANVLVVRALQQSWQCDEDTAR